MRQMLVPVPVFMFIADLSKNDFISLILMALQPVEQEHLAYQLKIRRKIVVGAVVQGDTRNGGRLKSEASRHADIASAAGHLSEFSKSHPQPLC